MTKIHPALAEHALLKNSELHQRIAELEAQVAALSQQAGPDHVEDMRAMVEPAPAQDERGDFFQWWNSELRAELRRSCAESWAYCIWKASDANTRYNVAFHLSEIEQTEQQPVAWRWMYNGESDGPYAFNYPLPDDDVVRRGLMAARPRTVQPLYAAPIAQTAPQDTVTVLEAWGAIGHDTGCNPGKDELLASLRHMAELATSEAALQPEQSGWIGVEDRLPEVAAGDEVEFIVCVYRSHNGESYSFSARFLNDYPLHTDYEDEPALHSGWYDVKEHAEYDGWYSPLIDEKSGDKVTHWMPLPAAPALAAQGAIWERLP